MRAWSCRSEAECVQVCAAVSYSSRKLNIPTRSCCWAEEAHQKGASRQVCSTRRHTMPYVWTWLVTVLISRNSGRSVRSFAWVLPL